MLTTFYYNVLQHLILRTLSTKYTQLFVQYIIIKLKLILTYLINVDVS